MPTPSASLRHIYPYYEGRFDTQSDHAISVVDKFTNRPVSTVGEVNEHQIQRALIDLADAQRSIPFTPRDRSAVLSRAADLMETRAADFAEAILTDTGFARADAETEVGRAISTLRLCAEESLRLAGEVVPIQRDPAMADRLAWTVFRPIGVICAITPFNSPLNTVVHKVGPALAAGNAVVLKPAEQTPRCADELLRLLLEAGLPPRMMAVLYGSGSSVGPQLLSSPIPGFYAFTGSTEVGRIIHASAGARPTQLEMGSLSSTIVCSDVDPGAIVDKLVAGSFRKAGQVCTSVQRLYVHEAVVADLAAELKSKTSALTAGDPRDAATRVGPVISTDEAIRVESWISDAVSAGAETWAGGTRSGNVIEPTILANVAPEQTIFTEEIFGPVVVMRTFTDLNTAIAEANATPYGLAAGIFTNRIDEALNAAMKLEMGSVHINATSSSRSDMMPYTGAKASGVGREGPAYAIREMSNERLITVGR